MNNIVIKGVNYDAGIGLFSELSGDEISDAEMIEAMRVIRNELHCNAVRIYGYDLDKLIRCSQIAVSEGLMVWFSPRRINASRDEALNFITRCSAAAEDLRKSSDKFVFVIGNEITLDLKGFIKGENIYDRISALSNPLFILKIMLSSGLNKELNDFLKKAVTVSRQYFKGEITYASGEWEKVDWDIFDIVGLNYYRNIFNSWNYSRTIGRYVRKYKKVAITEFGCCSYKGADLKGAWGYSVVDWEKPRPQLKKVYKRDEGVQSDYLGELLDLYSEKHVYAAFIYTFAARKSVYDADPLYDLDMANFGLIKVLPSNDKDRKAPFSWEKKKSFVRAARFYSGDSTPSAGHD